MKKKKRDNATGSLFIEGSGQMRILDKSYEQQMLEKEAVECLGMSFANDLARREYFLGILREKLKDPEFRKIEGFPVGEDEDILALSDPPYYTACPNPFISDFFESRNLEETSLERERQSAYSDDVVGNKHSRIYNVHPYHTKVPPEAIAPLIRHYTRPGDVILDPFAGTGMTGIAIDLCDEDDSKVAPRTTILCDLSPLAGFVAATYNAPGQRRTTFPDDWDKVLDATEALVGNYFKTKHLGWRAAETDPRKAVNQLDRGGTTYGNIVYTVWSEVYRCPHCTREFSYWDVAVHLFDCKVLEAFPCPECSTLLCKEPKFEKKHSATMVERATELWFDPVLSKTVTRQKRSPKLISVVSHIKLTDFF